MKQEELEKITAVRIQQEGAYDERLEQGHQEREEKAIQVRRDRGRRRQKVRIMMNK